VATALRDSHADEKRCHAEAMDRLQSEYSRLQRRIESAYEDKLDGRIDVAYFDRKVSEWRAEQASLRDMIERHELANKLYMDEGICLIELANRAAELFERQEPREKRRLLDFVVSNCTWANGELIAKIAPTV
jgi:hypothetical protein